MYIPRTCFVIMTVGWKSTATVGVVVLQENPRTENKHSCYAHGRKNLQIVSLFFIFYAFLCIHLVNNHFLKKKKKFSKEHQKNVSANALPCFPKDVHQENHLGYQTIDSSVLLHYPDSMSLVMGMSFKRHWNMWLMNLYNYPFFVWSNAEIKQATKKFSQFQWSKSFRSF